MSVRSLLRAFALLAVGAIGASPVFAQTTVEFNRDIRPILSNACFSCHGPDNNLRKADLRLDQVKGLYDDRDGHRMLVPGKPAESEIFRRITTHEKADRMPPAKVNKDLTKEQIAKIKTWIEQGAKYQDHWSLVPIARPAVPAVHGVDWVKTPIDAFVLAKLEQEKFKPSPAADRRTLARRLSFDLVGLPPAPEDVETLVADSSPQAIDRYVDKLLSSAAHGERMAVYWLDVVRYADTGGYHSDNHRDVYLYRDWVIQAFNKNMPFNEFVKEQIAGDLVPNATKDQRIASGYNRLLQTTEEGGAQPKEYSAKYFADRVRNTSTAFFGLTLGCTECHDHKYDPFSTKEFYKLGAFFADLQERPVGRQEQTAILSAEQVAALKSADDKIAQAQKKLADLGDRSSEMPKWEAEQKAANFKGLAKDVTAALKIAPEKRNAKQKEAVLKHFQSVHPALSEARQALDAAQKAKTSVTQAAPTTLVSMSVAPRPIRILPRGNWLDDSGEIVQPDVPASLPKLHVKDRRANRLDLAQWMVAKDHPLVARVFVNRLWGLLFGQGIAKTMDDLGNQGAAPTHPELLDWLAAEFQTDWDVRRLIRLIVSSNVYRQNSVGTAELRQRDPYNQLLARQGRFRLDAEFIRDNALAVSGLLVSKVGGPSVKPYQPAGYWRYLNFPTREWANDKGESQYRRGLYTYWQRTFLHPSLLAFDASTREECVVERPKSNTPQQALVLLNDPTYVEAARALAEHVVHEGGSTAESRIDFAFRRALQRRATADERKVLTKFVSSQVNDFRENPKEADAFLRVGQRPAPKDIPAPELAGWTALTRVVLNLHETITRD